MVTIAQGPRKGRFQAASAVVVALVLHWLIQAVADFRVAPFVTEDAKQLQYGSLLHRFEHHTLQMLAALAVIGVLSRGHWVGWGLNFRNAGESWKLLTRGFFPVLLASLLAGHAVVPLLDRGAPARTVDSSELVATLVFSLFLVGLSEEIVFRGLLHTWLARHVGGSWPLAGLRIPCAASWSAGIFAIAHIAVDGWPPTASADARQLLLAFVLGIYYALAYERTGSLLAPVIAHNAVDGGIVLVELGVSAAMVG